MLVILDDDALDDRERAFCICGHRISDHSLDALLHPFLTAAILITDVKDCMIRVSLEA